MVPPEVPALDMAKAKATAMAAGPLKRLKLKAIDRIEQEAAAASNQAPADRTKPVPAQQGWGAVRRGHFPAKLPPPPSRANGKGQI